jgi:hypothetical protein
MSNLLKTLLQVNPRKRPSCDEINQLSFVRKRMQDLQLDEDERLASLAMGGLLGTIQVPKNLKILREKLPKPHYRT